MGVRQQMLDGERDVMDLLPNLTMAARAKLLEHVVSHEQLQQQQAPPAGAAASNRVGSSLGKRGRLTYEQLVCTVAHPQPSGDARLAYSSLLRVRYGPSPHPPIPMRDAQTRQPIVLLDANGAPLVDAQGRQLYACSPLLAALSSHPDQRTVFHRKHEPHATPQGQRATRKQRSTYD